MPTTRKETRRVVPKREVVRRERGWRWGGMAVELRAGVVLDGRYNGVMAR